MEHRSEDGELLRSVGSPSLDEETVEKNVSAVNDGDAAGVVAEEDGNGVGGELPLGENREDDGDLPQCKIKRNYSCTLCPFFSQNPRSFLYHSRDVHFNRIKIFECSQCLYASKHSQKLQRHINMIHVPGKTRKSRNRMVRPDRKEPRPIRPKPPDPSPKNPVKVVTVLPDDQKQIADSENGDEPEMTTDGEFKCSACNFKHRNSKLLRRHEKIVHMKERYFKCSKCSYVTHVTARFTKHVKYHSMPMIKCDLCDFRTPYKWNLDRHYKNHSGSGAFQCAKCNFRADIKQSLTVHEMNHHVPPVGQEGAIARRRNKVGSSEAQGLDFEEPAQEDLDLLFIEKEDPDLADQEGESADDQKPETSKKAQNLRSVKHPYNKRESANNNHLRSDFIHPDDIVPRYGQIFVKNLKCKYCSYKAVFSHEIWRHEKRIHGHVPPERKKENAAKRPPPQLIPIQSKGSSGAILKIPSVKNKSEIPSVEEPPLDKPVDETEFNEMYSSMKKSILTSSLKDFVFLIGDEEGLKTIPDSSPILEELEGKCSGKVPEVEDGAESRNGEVTKQEQTDLLKMKNASFFDRLKEKLLTGNSEEQNLFCEVCGHESKCLSEAVAHQKVHSNAQYKSDSEGQSAGDVVLFGTTLSSTRCQHCRLRCKTSTDLVNHLKSCKAFEASLDSQLNTYSVDEAKVKTEEVSPEDETRVKTEEESPESEMKEGEDETSMENRVFVWNDLGQVHNDGDSGEGMDVDAQLTEEPLITSPGYGTVTSKGSDNTESGTLVMEADPRLNVIVKKVFKCPHCSFWASTASRFHVHIVGHLNKKPFECSLCMYRSNWRWDITKHIRLKSLRDPSHTEAKVNMTDETGRRNYSKYNNFLTMMRVQEPTAESSGYGRRSRFGDVTQGNANDGDIIPLPAPPRLTRAPVPGVPHHVPQGLPLRPPPPLKAAHHIHSRVLGQSVKKTFWKCKKCNFRDTQKGRVLLHVRKHYMVKKKGQKGSRSNSSDGSPAPGAEQRDSNPELRSLLKMLSYSCGHCHQVSHWKHVIQRHCMLKHNGNALIEVTWKGRSGNQSGNQEEEEKQEGQEDQENQVEQEEEEENRERQEGQERQEGEENQENQEEQQKKAAERRCSSTNSISCDICPFTTDTEGDLTAHKLNHVDRPGSIFKCTYCPFYVPSKIAVLEHMEVHGVSEGCDLASLKVDNFDPDEELVPQKTRTGTGQGEPTKKYKCLQCPYLSNSRTQFLYHKQFHRPRNSPFKCLYCTYNVSRRHLLHQHLRVHHNREGKPRGGEQQQAEKVDSETGKQTKRQPTAKETEQPDDKQLLGLEFPEIPLVWVLKSGNIHKMYKCRWCPHVNVRKINIQEHEKMHQENKKSVTNGFKLQCSDCNYTCNNAGVLASHIKVHLGFYGEVRSLVDPTRPDAEQIQELQNSLRMMEPEVVVVEGSAQEVQLKDPPLSSQPENAYSHTTQEESKEDCRKILSFCDKCPARFFYRKELKIHSKFHMIHLPFRCSYCTYTARQRPHLLAHYKVHSQEYQDKTHGLVEAYAVSPEYPQPKTVIITKDSCVMEGPVWVVRTTEMRKAEGKALPKHACHRCPAKFFKSVALQYHLTFHGGSYQHKCKYCDYTVKTYGNLMKHQLVHEEKPSKAKFSYSFPISGTDFIQTQEEGKKPEEKKATDPQFGTLMHGSPEFIYPKYMKKGKMKEKKYKCPKCPSAFEKRDQYRVHLSLHGSRQRYNCGKCDYSVKYYANYAQHLRKHENHDEALKARKSDDANEEPPVETKEGTQDYKKPFELTLLEQQTLLLQERKKSTDGREEDRKTFSCAHCPYTSIRKDAIENHSWRHYAVSGIKSGFECEHCDYSATQRNFLREHVRLHFATTSRFKPEAFLKCEKMELWCCDEDAKDPRQLLIFQDRGEEELDRYFPPMQKFDSDQDDLEWKIYVNPQTGEPVKENGEPEECFDAADSPQNEDLIEMIEEEVEEVQVEKVKPKRCRGKNWRCRKCPHAFGKKDQYLRHIALHGSNQRHNCDICDYSVKFYTNYVQHMRMHQMHEPDRVIYVKKNFQSLVESSERFLAASLVEESDSCPSQEERQNVETGGSLDDENSECNESLIINESEQEKEENPSENQN